MHLKLVGVGRPRLIRPTLGPCAVSAMPRLGLWKECVTRVLEVSMILSLSIRLRAEPLLSDLSLFSFGTLLYRSGIVVNNTSLNPYSHWQMEAA